VDVTLRIVRLPCLVLIEGGVEVEEVREEAARGDLAGVAVEVVVGIAGEVGNSLLLFPYLDGEDGCGSVSDALIGRIEDFADDAAAFRGGVGSVVDGGEDHLVATTGVDGVHVVNEGLHRLVDAADGLVDGVLAGALGSLESDKVALDIVVNLGGFQLAVIFVLHFGNLVDFLLEGLPDIGSEIEVEGGDCLAAMHLVLDCLHGNAGEDARRFNPLRRAGLAVARLESMLENQVERVLDTGQGLRRIVVLVMDMDVIVLHRLADIFGEEAFIHIGLGRLGGEFHHHAGRGVGVHVGILPGDVVDLGIDDVLENLGGFSFAGEVALVAVGDIFLRNFLAGALHELHLDAVLDILDAHFLLVYLGNGLGDLGCKDDVLPIFGNGHGLEDCGHDFLVVEVDVSSVTFQYALYHSWQCVSGIAGIYAGCP